MVIQRYYKPDNTPAFLTIAKRTAEGDLNVTRLIYPRAHNFKVLWDKGVDATPL